MKKYYLLCFLLAGIFSNAQYTDLHNFSIADGYSSLSYLNGHLYGTVNRGGTNDSGYIYSLNTDGTGFTILYSFSASTGTTFPCGSLLYDNGIFYGMTSQGDGVGTIYKINVDGSGYLTLHSFVYHNPSDGSSPQGSLIISGNVLYGMTRKGGAVYTQEIGGEGAIFKINTDGTNFALLHSFDYGEENPYGSLLLDGNFLYGMTSTHSSNINSGKIFKINTDGTSYTILHNFSGADGAKPNGNLVISGSTLYGMTPFGGNIFTGIRRGNIFKIDTDGSGFQSIFNDLNGSTSYTWSYGSLVLVDNVLYGKSNVNLYSINTDGTGYQWYNWSLYGTAPESFDPMENGNLTYGDGALYGVNNRFGGTLGGGVIYKFSPSSLVQNTFTRTNEITVYPNPANDYITIDGGNSISIIGRTIKINNTMGQEIFTSIVKTQPCEVSLRTLNLHGVYFVKIYDEASNLIHIKKIIVQ